MVYLRGLEYALLVSFMFFHQGRDVSLEFVGWYFLVVLYFVVGSFHTVVLKVFVLSFLLMLSTYIYL